MENLKSEEKKGRLKKSQWFFEIWAQWKGPYAAIHGSKRKKEKFPIHDQRNTYILRSTNEQWFSKSKRNSQDSEDNIQKEWETFAGEIRNTCVSIRIVRKWICSELFVCMYREIWLNWK